MNIQDIANRLNWYQESRRKTNEAAYNRSIHNEHLQDIIEELSLIGLEK